MSFWDYYYGAPKKKKKSTSTIIVGGRKYVAVGSTRRQKSRPRESYYPSRQEHVSVKDLYYGGKAAYTTGKAIAKSRPVKSLRKKVSNKLEDRKYSKAGFKSTRLNLGSGSGSY